MDFERTRATEVWIREWECSTKDWNRSYNLQSAKLGLPRFHLGLKVAAVFSQPFHPLLLGTYPQHHGRIVPRVTEADSESIQGSNSSSLGPEIYWFLKRVQGALLRPFPLLSPKCLDKKHWTVAAIDSQPRDPYSRMDFCRLLPWVGAKAHRFFFLFDCYFLITCLNFCYLTFTPCLFFRQSASINFILQP